jgi:hypothetical protein
MAKSLKDKVSKAKNKADDAKIFYADSQNIAKKVAKNATGKELTFNEADKAGKVVQNRRVLDTGKTAMRGAAILKRSEKKAAYERKVAATTGASPKKREIKPTAATAKFNAATKAANAAKKAAAKKKK